MCEIFTTEFKNLMVHHLDTARIDILKKQTLALARQARLDLTANACRSQAACDDKTSMDYYDHLMRHFAKANVGYGMELFLDLHDCNTKQFTRERIEQFFIELCNMINMERQELFWWDDHGVPIEEQQTEPHLVGTSAVQFITTSNIVIHTLDILKRVYLNVFSCKQFSAAEVVLFARNYFDGTVVQSQMNQRI